MISPMEQLYKIAEFYKQIKTNLSLTDQLKQLRDIFPIIWGENPLFLYNMRSREFENLNANYKENLPQFLKSQSFFKHNLTNFPITAEQDGYAVLFTIISIEGQDNGILFTFFDKNQENGQDVINKFNLLSLLVIQNVLKNTYYEFNQLGSFIFSLEKTCLSGFDTDTVIFQIMNLLKKQFPDFNHIFYVFNEKRIYKYFLNEEATPVKEENFDTNLAVRLNSFFTLSESSFIELDDLHIVGKIVDQYNQYALLEISSPYYHFWKNEIKVYYEITMNTLAQTLARLKLFEEVQQEKQMLEELNQFKKDITSMIAHDLSSPLMGIMGYLGILRGMEADLSSRSLGYLNKAYRLTLRLNKLVEDFRLLNQIDDNRVDLNLQPTPVQDFIKNIIKFYEDLYPTTFHLDIRDPELFIEMDIAYFSRVLENLINNSIKYVGEQVEIFIRQSIEDNFLIIDYHDNGPGISDEEIPIIFNKYERGKGKKKAGGSGLGLYICKIITELHNGKIIGENQPDGYTHFKIYIPKNR